MKRKKVLVLTTTFPRWKDDSTPAFVYDLSKELNKHVDIVVLAPHHYGAKKFEIMDGMKVYRFSYFLPEKLQRLCYEGGIMGNLKRSFLAKIQVPFLVLAELIYAIKLVKKEKIDVIHSHWIIPSGFVGAVCKKLFNIKHIMTEHAAGLSGLDKLPFKSKIAEFCVKNSDNITFVSTFVKNRFLKIFYDNEIEKKISIIPMGVNVEQFRLKQSKKELRKKHNITWEHVLLFVGRIAEKKGLRYLLEAMPKIIEERKDVGLIVCGSGPLMGEMIDLTKKLGIEKNVLFTGYIVGRKKVEFFNLADILVVPSIVDETGDTEGMPVVIMEGMAAGLPIVASDVGGVSDIINNGKSGLLIKSKDIEKLNRTILNVINSKRNIYKIQTNNFIYSNKFSLKKISKNYINLILT
ncbi:MAG: glycosyltransferase family 4 protein [Candidatus Aenigmarchaeota archaeon]|nr:glycosyltransferase family 4 protein [Candidatus Aenigmarchaeota archaeon]